MLACHRVTICEILKVEMARGPLLESYYYLRQRAILLRARKPEYCCCKMYYRALPWFPLQESVPLLVACRCSLDPVLVLQICLLIVLCPAPYFCVLMLRCPHDQKYYSYWWQFATGFLSTVCCHFDSHESIYLYRSFGICSHAAFVDRGLILVMLLDLEKQTSTAISGQPEPCRRTEHCWTGMQVMVIAVMVSLLAVKIAIDIAIDTTIFQRLQSHTMTIRSV